ncbi:MAG: DUF1559 domain-containing protein [Thermoguttaceae bacterium]|nr:DUF1559 domain-containing protein [Thermoguttaceae bacterium]
MRSSAAIALLLLLSSSLPAAEPDPAAMARVIAPFIDEQTMAVAHLDLGRIEVQPLVDQVVKWFPEAQEARDAMAGMLGLFLPAVRQAAGNDAYFVVSLADLPRSPPFAVLPTAEASNDAMLRSLLEGKTPYTVARLGTALVVASPATVERLRTLKPDPRPDLPAALAAAGDAAARLAVIPTAVHRRVIEETMPQLPKEVGGGETTVFTQGMMWATVALSLPPQPSLRLVVQSRDAAAAEALGAKWNEAIRLLPEQESLGEHAADVEKILQLLKPSVAGDRLTVTLDEAGGGLGRLIAALQVPLEMARQDARRSQSMNNLKQIGLAMHLFQDKYKHLPTPASYDTGGKPLLSWRVHLLPFLDQEDLYKRFRLDEPWDSEHNRQLIAKMPPVYRSPLLGDGQPGLTSYFVPVGEGTMFPGGKPITFADVRDGLSNTIMAIEADPKQAVVWTSPEDLPFDPAQPARGLGGPYPAGVLALLGDGSVRVVPLEMVNDAENLRRLFLINDRQPIKWP